MTDHNHRPEPDENGRPIMFDTLVEQNVDGIIVLGKSGVILYANPAARLFLGRDNEELIGATFGEPLVAGAEAEVDLLSTNGTRITAEMRSTPIHWHGEPAVLASFRDISDRKKAEQEALNAVRLRDRFLAMLSHELRNPMSAILTAAHLVQHADSNEQAKSAAETIQRQGMHTARLLEDLLDVSRVTQGKITIKREETDVVRVMHDVLQQLKSAAEAKRITVIEKFAAASIMAMVDPTRIQQIFINLVQNAIKYSREDGAVVVELSTTNNELLLVVSDDGEGIAPEILPNIFQPFVQSDTTLARSAGGIGVGLTLVKELVGLHDGVVSAKSDGAGQGTEFAVSIPLEPTGLAVQHKNASELCDDQAEFFRLPDKTNCRPRILLVEDIDDNRRMLCRLLELEGYDVDTARHGGEAMMLIHQNQYDAALIDIGLPVMSGLEVARRVRANPDSRKIALLAVTGYGQAEDRRNALHAGFDEHFVKPFEPRTLTTYLRECGLPIPKGRSKTKSVC